MTAYYSPMSDYLIICGIAILAALVNIPLGYLRQPVPKFSFAWYFYIHISIPLIIYLRIKAGYSWKIIPFTIGAAIAGQIIGARIRKKRGESGQA